MKKTPKIVPKKDFFRSMIVFTILSICIIPVFPLNILFWILTFYLYKCYFNYEKYLENHAKQFPGNTTTETKATIPTAPTRPKYKNIYYKVAGVSFREKEIKTLLKENPDFSYTKKELIDACKTDESVYKYYYKPKKVTILPEPTNEHDSNALKVIVDEVHVGYIPKDNCTSIQNLIDNNKIVSMTATIGSGDYKYIESDHSVDFNSKGDAVEKTSYTLNKGNRPITIKLIVKATE